MDGPRHPGSTKFLDAWLEAYRQSGCRIVIGRQVVDKPNPLRLPVYTTDDAVRHMEDTIRRYDGQLDGRRLPGGRGGGTSRPVVSRRIVISTSTA